MADDIRIKDLQSTASYMESDDYLGIDSLASGTRKINFAGLMDSEDDRLPTTDKTPRGAISEIKQSLSQLFKTKMITHNFTAGAMANVAWNGWTECNNEAGYTPIGVLDFACNTSAIEVVNCTILNTSGGMTIKNTTNSTVTNSFLYTVLYQKNL